MRHIRAAQSAIDRMMELIKRSIRGDDLTLVNEIAANVLCQLTMTLLNVLLIITWVLTKVGLFKLDLFYVSIICIPNFILLSIGIILLVHFEVSKPWLKNVALFLICITVGSCTAILGFRCILTFCIPAILSTRYMSRKLTKSICIFSAFLIIVSSVSYCIMGISLDFNVIDLPANTVLTFNGPLDSTLHVHDVALVPYIINMFKYSIFTNLFIFFVISMICCAVASQGYRLVNEQRKLSAEKATINTELTVAKEIQEHAMPIVHDLQEDNSFELYASMDPAKEIGGDFYDFLKIDDIHLAMVIADVSGKGVPAAMFMMVSKLLIDNSMQTGKSPGDILTEVNHQLCEKNLDDMFVTVWIGIINLENGEIVTANGGHEYPLIRRAGGKFEILKDKHGLVLGGMDGLRYKEEHFKLKPGDTLFVYTDGVTEANNFDGDFYGLEHARDQLNAINKENMEEMVKDLRKDIADFAGEASQFDDITMMGFRFNHYKTKDGRIFAPTKESISVVEAYLEDKMEAAEVTMKQISRMNVAIDEIYSNIVNYSHATWVKAGVDIDDNQIKVKFLDNGIPYNPLDKTDPDITIEAEDREIGGLGIFLTKKLMSEVIYKYEAGNNFNVLILNRD